ncbi:MAG: paraquat-inducible protein A [Amaricoccus sp.]
MRPSTDLIACPVCDLLHAASEPPPEARIRCRRCHTVLMTNRRGAFDRTLAAAFGSLILMIGAITFPFLEMSIAGTQSRASVLEVAFAFNDTIEAPLSAAICLLIIVIPMLRATALIYTVLPLRLGFAPAPGAQRAFRLVAELRPWSMAEVFVVGVVVALVKMAGMASIGLGPAFWALAGLVLLVVYETVSLCEWTVWRELEARRA